MPETPKYIPPTDEKIQEFEKAFRAKEHEPPEEPVFGPTKSRVEPKKENETKEKEQKHEPANVERLIAGSPECDDWIEVMADFAFNHEDNLPKEKRAEFREFMQKGPGMMRIDFLKGINSYIGEMLPGENPYDAMLQKHQLSLDEQEIQQGEKLGDTNLTPKEQAKVNEQFLQIQQSRELILQMKRALKHMREKVTVENKINLS